uniref:Uncharacterized protein n=1 Tax=Daphnia magna TaxID=35525 RepID=A0A0P4YVP3_9CRUS
MDGEESSTTVVTSTSSSYSSSSSTTLVQQTLMTVTDDVQVEEGISDTISQEAVITSSTTSSLTATSSQQINQQILESGLDESMEQSACMEEEIVSSSTVSREEVITQEALHSPSALLDEEEQLLVEELLVEEDQSLSAEAFTTEMEPSIEMAEDLKEPGNDDGGVDDSGTEINTSIGDVDQQEELAQEHQQSTEADLSIQEPQSTEADQTVASGSECRPVEAGDLSGSSSNNREIQQENIKHALHEIISEIDREMEADFSNEEVEETGQVIKDESILLINSGQAAQRKRSPPPVQPKKARPVSVPANFLQEGSGGPISPETGKPIDLQKIFTPASDFPSGDITPRRQRRMYTSSSFYSSSHPSMEEQVELARQISHSLSADTNSTSKGQSMYVKRRNRSSKWIHEANLHGGVDDDLAGDQQNKIDNTHQADDDGRMTFKIPNIGAQEIQFRAKSPLKLLMNPKGQIWDLKSLRNTGMHIEAAQLSPEICSSLVKDLQSPKGKGAALFAKRKQKSEKWIVDENTVKQKTANAAAMAAAAVANEAAAAPTAMGQTRVDQAQKMASVQDALVGPRLKLVKSPWEAALKDGTVDTAFQDLRSNRLSGVANQSGILERKMEPLPPMPTTTLSAAAPVQPKLNMKPLESVPKMLPHFKAQPQTSTAAETESVPVAAPVEEKPFVPTPLRPDNVNPYKPKAAKGWGNAPVDALSTVEFATPKTNAVLEHVQTKQRPVTMPPISVTGDQDGASEQAENAPKSAQVLEDGKHNPFGFELPVLRSVSTTQLPPPIVRQEPELILPTLRPVPEKTVEPSDSAAVDTTPAVQWELPPLDSRPNLQALLEREKRASEAVVNDEALKHRQEQQQRKQQQEELQRKQQQEEQLRKLQEEDQLKKQQQQELKKQQEELQRKQQEAQQKAMVQQLEQQQLQKRQQQQIVMTEEMRMAQEAQLAKLSVRLKVQRFESAGPTPVNYIGQVSVSQSGSPRQSGIQTPSHVVLTGRNKANPATIMPAKENDVRSVCNSKENAAPLQSKPLGIPRMMEMNHQNESIPSIPKPAMAVSHNQPPAIIQQHQPTLQMLESFPAVQLRQPSTGKTLINTDDGESSLSLNRRSLADYTNYNTAPRGWTSAAKEIYRPVTFKMA